MDDRSDWLKETELEMSGKHYYTDEKNAQIVIAILKAHVLIANPRTTASRGQNEPCFEMWF